MYSAHTTLVAQVVDFASAAAKGVHMTTTRVAGKRNAFRKLGTPTFKSLEMEAPRNTNEGAVSLASRGCGRTLG